MFKNSRDEDDISVSRFNPHILKNRHLLKCKDKLQIFTDDLNLTDLSVELHHIR